MVGDELGVVPNAPDKRGSSARLPRQAEKIDTGFGRYSALMDWFSFCIDRIHLEPRVIDGKSGGPNDGRDTGFGQIQLQQRVGNALRIGSHFTGFGFWWKFETVSFDISVGFIQ